MGAAAVVIAAWLGYPAGVWLLSLRRPPEANDRLGDSGRPDSPPPWPLLSLIIAAHNEAAGIIAKLQNSVALEYPPDRLEILISEDGSEDGTAALAAAFADARARVLSAPARLGKAAALNRAVAAARGEILVFSDANNLYSQDALLRLLAPFADARVGAVAGRKTVAAAAGVGGGESVYWRWEHWLLARESRLGTLVSAPGEILAVRRELFAPLPAEDGGVINDDLWIVWGVLARGRAIRFAPRAVSREMPAANPREEWRRRRRMARGRAAALRRLWPQWRRLPFGAKAQILFHKWLRTATPFAMLVALIAGAGLAIAARRAPEPAWLWALVIAQFFFYALAALTATVNAAGRRLGWLEAPFFFLAAQAAVLAAAWPAFSAGAAKGGGWRRVRRAPGAPPETSGATRRDRTDARRRAPRPPGEAPTLTRRVVVSNLAWAGTSFALGKVVVFASVAILARILAPRDFGVITMALAAIAVLEIFGRLGLYSALIYEPGEASAAASPVFWLTLFAAVVEVAAAWRAAPWLGLFFHMPRLAPMLRVLAPTLVISALGGTHDLLLRRALSFRAKLVPDLAMAAAKATGSVVLALFGFGAWSLIWGQWLGLGAATLVLWRVMPWRPRWEWDRATVRRLFAYAKHIYLMETSGTILVNLDSITIGRFLSASLLGFYHLAFRIPEVLLVSVLNVITGVVFPALSRLQDDLAALQAGLLRTVRYSTLLGIPLAAGMGLLSRDFIYTVYGAHWARSVPVLRVLAIYVGLRCVSHHFGDAYKAMGRPEVLSKITLLWWLALPPSLYFGARWGGIVGVAWGQVAARAVLTAAHCYLVVRVVRVTPRRLWGALAPAFEATAVMAAGVLALRKATAGWPPLPALAALAAAGAAIYFLWLALRRREVLLFAWTTARQLGGVQREAAGGAPK